MENKKVNSGSPIAAVGLIIIIIGVVFYAINMKSDRNLNKENQPPVEDNNNNNTNDNDNKVVNVTSVSLDRTSVSLKVGGSITLKATVSPSNATNKNITWSSSNTSVATVNGGVVVAKGVGKANITAKSNNGKTATCVVTVTNKDSHQDNKITITFTLKGAKEVSIVVGSKWNDPGFKVTGSDGKDYSSKVKVSGTVNTNKVGTYKIEYKLSAGDANKTLTRTVKVVSKSVSVSSIKTDKSEYSLYVNEQTTIKSTVSPSDATNKSLSYQSSNTSVATVDSNGKVTGKAVGTAVITITSVSNSNIKTTCKVTVKKKDSGTTTGKTEEKIHFINIVAGDAILIESNGKYGLIDAGNPSNTGDSYFDVGGSGTTVLNYLNSKGVKHLEFIIGSHAHSDHIGGIQELISKSSLVDKNTTFIYKQVSRDSSPYGEITIGEGSRFTNTDCDWKSTWFLERAKNAVSGKGGTLLETSTHSSSSMSKLGASFVKNSDKWMDYITFKMEDLTLKIYNLYEYTETSGGKKYIDLNSNSLVTIITSSNGKKVWLSGDLNVRSDYEKYYADRIGKVDVLKANHHGHLFSNSRALLSKTKPSHFIIPNTGGTAVAAAMYVKNYGGNYYYSGKNPVVVTLGSKITVSSENTNVSLANHWGGWNLNGESVYWIYVGSNNQITKNGWAKYEGGWYYLGEDGFMVKNKWVQDKGKWYYLGPDGKMYSNTTKVIDGKKYTFDSSGACTVGDGC